MKKVEAYRCDHCGRLFRRDYDCRRHEDEICTKNLNLRPLCYDCRHYDCTSETEEIEIFVDSCFAEDSYTKEFTPNRCRHPENDTKLYNCRKFDGDIQAALGDSGYEQMPSPKSGGCKYFEQSKYGKIRTI